MKKFLRFASATIVCGFTSLAIACGSTNPPQKGWDKYCSRYDSSTKTKLENGLTLYYIWFDDSSMSSGKAVYYKGSYGSWNDSERSASTTFYFTYDIDNDVIESSSNYIFSLAESLTGSYKCTTGYLFRG